MWRFTFWKTRDRFYYYLIPTLFIHYTKCKIVGRSVEKQGFMIGLKFFSYSIVFHGVNDDTSNAA